MSQCGMNCGMNQCWLPKSAAEWVCAPGAGSLHALAHGSSAPVASPALATVAVRQSPVAVADARERQTPRIGLLTSASSSGSCADCGQHQMFCSCSGYQRDTRLSEHLDPRSPRSALSASVKVAKPCNFELALSQKAVTLTHAQEPAVSQKPRRVSFAHEQPKLEAREVADMMSSARRRRQSVPAIDYVGKPQALKLPGVVEIVENYFDYTENKADESDDEEQTQVHQAEDAVNYNGLGVAPIVKSRSLVFEDAENDMMLGRTPPSC